MFFLVFKVLNLVQAPDGDHEKHRLTLKTSMIEITTIVVKFGDINEAVTVAKEMVEKEGVHSISVCPGFSHEAVAKISQAVGGRAAVNVSRGDPESTLKAVEILMKEGWFPKP